MADYEPTYSQQIKREKMCTKDVKWEKGEKVGSLDEGH